MNTKKIFLKINSYHVDDILYDFYDKIKEISNVEDANYIYNKFTENDKKEIAKRLNVSFKQILKDLRKDDYYEYINGENEDEKDFTVEAREFKFEITKDQIKYILENKINTTTIIDFIKSNMLKVLSNKTVDYIYDNYLYPKKNEIYNYTIKVKKWYSMDIIEKKDLDYIINSKILDTFIPHVRYNLVKKVQSNK